MTDSPMKGSPSQTNKTSSSLRQEGAEEREKRRLITIYSSLIDSGTSPDHSQVNYDQWPLAGTSVSDF